MPGCLPPRCCVLLLAPKSADPHRGLRQNPTQRHVRIMIHTRFAQSRAASTGEKDPPEVVMNDMEPAGQQHLSLSKSTVLRAHQIEPFVEGLKEAVKSSRR